MNQQKECLEVEIKKRWKKEHGPLCRNEFMNYIKEKKRLKPSPYKDIDGFMDYRGLELPELFAIKRVKFKNIDFSYMKVSRLRIRRSKFKHCRFNNSDLSGIYDKGNTFKDCEFYKVSFRYGGLGYAGSKYVDCVFNNCSFSNTNFVRAEFTNCKFIDCNLKSVDFNGSSFDNCEFEGLLFDIIFRGGYSYKRDIFSYGIPKKNKMKNVSFKKAVFSYTDFRNNCPLDRVIIPETSKSVKVVEWKEFLIKLSKVEHTDIKIKKDINLYFEVFVSSAETQNTFIIDYHDIKTNYSEEAADIIFKEAEKHNKKHSPAD